MHRKAMRRAEEGLEAGSPDSDHEDARVQKGPGPAVLIGMLLVVVCGALYVERNVLGTHPFYAYKASDYHESEHHLAYPSEENEVAILADAGDLSRVALPPAAHVAHLTREAKTAAAATAAASEPVVAAPSPKSPGHSAVKAAAAAAAAAPAAGEAALGASAAALPAAVVRPAAGADGALGTLGRDALQALVTERTAAVRAMKFSEHRVMETDPEAIAAAKGLQVQVSLRLHIAVREIAAFGGHEAGTV